jgi:hypothetical protein
VRGEVAEWFKALVLKTSVLEGTVGSNPTFTVFRGDFEKSNAGRLHEYLFAVLYSGPKPLGKW